jgi:membrane fusion protein (multidrug efflux system)
MPYDEPQGSGQGPAGTHTPTRADAPTRDRPGERARPEEPERRPDERDEQGAGSGRREDQGKSRNPWIRLVLIVLVVAAIGGGTAWWYLTRNQESTDDAYTDGRAIMVASKISGYVVSLNVTDNQRVHAGDVLLRIDARDYVAARDAARGQLEAAEGQLAAARAALDLARVTYPAQLASTQAQLTAAQAVETRAQADLRRQEGLPRAARTQQSLDEATATARSAEAQVAQAQAAVRQAEPVQQHIAEAEAQVKQLEGQVAQAKAQLDQAAINLGYTVITAPQEGWVTKRNVEQGNYVSAGASLMSLVSPQVWVTANFKENQLDRMRPGQKVDISVDAYPGLKLKGQVDSIQLGTGSRFSAFPPENATGNFVKIVQRVPVKILIDEGLDPNLPLPLGLSVVPTVRLK